jgi:hypothetical protein
MKAHEATAEGTLSMIFTPVILVCLAAQAHYECTRQTAQDVFFGEPAKNEMMCGFYGQAALAGTSIGRSLRQGEWIKVTCERTQEARNE